MTLQQMFFLTIFYGLTEYYLLSDITDGLSGLAFNVSEPWGTQHWSFGATEAGPVASDNFAWTLTTTVAGLQIKRVGIATRLRPSRRRRFDKENL